VNQKKYKEQNDSLDRLHSAIGGELLDGTDLSSPEAKEALAAITLNAQTEGADKSMSVSLVKKALRLGI